MGRLATSLLVAVPVCGFIAMLVWGTISSAYEPQVLDGWAKMQGQPQDGFCVYWVDGRDRSNYMITQGWGLGLTVWGVAAGLLVVGWLAVALRERFAGHRGPRWAFSVVAAACGAWLAALVVVAIATPVAVLAAPGWVGELLWSGRGPYVPRPGGCRWLGGDHVDPLAFVTEVYLGASAITGVVILVGWAVAAVVHRASARQV